MAQLTLVICTILATFALSQKALGCEMPARTEAGWVCGARRQAGGGVEYASFRGVPYAQQPLGELRFKELQPLEPWSGYLNATTEGPVCPYHDTLYGPLVQPQGVSEACIHANIHVPIDALPDPDTVVQNNQGLPILVFVHGGGWVCGSGDADFNGPEYLMRGKDIIFITMNYRLDFLGFLYLNTPKVPGNNALRDVVTLLRWVQSNAAYFGGDPGAVTLAGQSAGSSTVHLLTLSPAAEGLFHRAVLMSGTSVNSSFTTSPVHAQESTDIFLSALNITTKDYDEVHDQLVQLPIDVLMTASKVVLDKYGFNNFGPVLETQFPGVTPIISDDPKNLEANGNGNNIPMLIGFTSNECETIRPRIIGVDEVGKYQQDPTIGVSPVLTYSCQQEAVDAMADKVRVRYMGATPDVERYIRLCSDSFFAYPAIRLARARGNSGGAPVYLYKFAYEAEHSVVKEAFNLTYHGAGHIEDLNRISKVNAFPVAASEADENMTKWMTELFRNFVKYGTPSPDGLWAASSGALEYNYIEAPAIQYVPISADDQDMVNFFDTLPDV